MADVKSSKICKFLACQQPKCFESNHCAKHSCAKCYGVGRVGAFKVICPSCGGKGTTQKPRGFG